MWKWPLLLIFLFTFQDGAPFLRPRRLCPSRSFLHMRPLLALHTHTSPAVPLRHHATTPLLLLSTSLLKKNLSLSPFFFHHFTKGLHAPPLSRPRGLVPGPVGQPDDRGSGRGGRIFCVSVRRVGQGRRRETEQGDRKRASLNPPALLSHLFTATRSSAPSPPAAWPRRPGWRSRPRWRW